MVLAAAVSLAPSAFARTGQPSLHQEALAALADTRTAVAEIIRSSEVTASDPTPFMRDAQRSINALVGHADPDYRGASGDAADRDGAIGHLDRLLHTPGTQPWNHAVHAAWVNEMVAVSQLKKALREKGLDEYQIDVTDALESLEIAIGRDSTGGSLGGLEGALATTELGVPDGATRVSGCAAPTRAPAYGLAKGYLLYIAVPTGHGLAELPQSFGIRHIASGDGFVVLRTAAEAQTAKLCGTPPAPHPAMDHHAAADPPARVVRVAAADPPDPPAADALPKLYTEQQAKMGKSVYAAACASCHGDQLQGKSAPPNGGTAFLDKAKSLGWSVSDMRYLIVNSMPLNNPGSLTDQQYADVQAFLLASDCYPAGKTPFPTKDTAKLKHVHLAPPKQVHPDDPKLGTCQVN